MELVGYSKRSVDLPEGEYEGVILKDNSEFIHVFLGRDDNVKFPYDSISGSLFTKGLCTIKIVKGRAAIYVS